MGEGTVIVSESKSDPEVVREFVGKLTSEERTLVIIRDELYDGKWDEMLRDLEARLQAKPYVFRLATRIEDDVVRIRKLSEFEQQHDLNLKDHV